MRHSCLLVLSFPLLVLASGGSKGEPVPDKKDEAVRCETTPPRLSLYLPIPLRVPRVDEPSTGVFVPDNYRVGDQIDLVVFLRGYDVKRPKAATAVREYWNSPKHSVLKSFLFREEVNRSGKNVILVVPALGPFAEAGKLTDDGGMQGFLGRIVDGLVENGPHAGRAKRPTIRHLILAAHSGGGAPLRRIAQMLGDDVSFKDKVKECGGFAVSSGAEANTACACRSIGLEAA
jgi:hypothetical protein